jgi:hypothetical protein
MPFFIVTAVKTSNLTDTEPVPKYCPSNSQRTVSKGLARAWQQIFPENRFLLCDRIPFFSLLSLMPQSVYFKFFEIILHTF